MPWVQPCLLGLVAVQVWRSPGLAQIEALLDEKIEGVAILAPIVEGNRAGAWTSSAWILISRNRTFRFAH